MDRYFNIWVRYRLAKAKRDPYHQLNHFRPQTAFTPAAKGQVLRFEDGITNAINHVAAKLDLPPVARAPHEMKSPRRPVRITARNLKRIDDFYAQDFEQLGYPRASTRNPSVVT